MPFVRKHSIPLALLTVLAAAVAAPYLIPQNPDAAVFRSGILGALLLAACFYPVRESLLRCTSRELIGGLCWGFLFAAALSAGSELFVYSGLLPGLGSAVRRMAAPVLATPLLGSLCAQGMRLRLPSAAHAKRVPTPVFAAILLLCWAPVLLAYFPGMINYDFVGEYGQRLSGQYDAIHPLLYSLIELSLLDLGERMFSLDFGLLLTTLARMLSLAFALACGCAFAQRRGAPRWALLLVTAFFALHPIFPMLAVSTGKDAPFCAALFVLSLLSWELLEAPEGFLADKRRCALFALMAVLTVHLRKNGLFAPLFLLPALVAALRGYRVRAMYLCAVSAVCCALAQVALTLCLSPVPQPSGQLYSLPAQQLVRAYNVGSMSDEDRAELEGWYAIPTGLYLHEHNADRAKNNLDRERLNQNGGEFLALWARNARSNAREYVEAFLLLNMGLWYPDDLSHSTIYYPTNYDPPGYLETDMFADQVPEFSPVCLLPRVRGFIERICKQNSYQQYPVISILFCTATPFWALLFALALLVVRGRARMTAAAFGVLGVWLSYLLGPCTLPRYVLPLFCLAPVMLIAALALPREKETCP